MAERVGFIGLGIMGSRMAANLGRAGFDLTVWNRTRATADAWAERHGASVADSPADLAARSDVVITMVVDDAQVRAVLLDGPDPVAAGAHEGLLCIDMSTIAPTTSREIAAELAKRRSPSSTHRSRGPPRRPRTGPSRSWSGAIGRTSSGPGRCSRRWAG